MTNPYSTAGAVLNPSKIGWFWQLPGVTKFGQALLNCNNKLNWAWQIKDGKYTGLVKLTYHGKEYIRTKDELTKYLIACKAM